MTTPARTIADLRRAAGGGSGGAGAAGPSRSPKRTGSAGRIQRIVSPRELRRAIRQAEVLGLATGAEAITAQTRSDLELAFRRLCRRHDLPAPEVNVLIDAMEVDFLWRDRRLVVETDGYRYHRGRTAFENDRDRDLRLRSLGFDVIRLSEQQVADEPERLLAVLRKLILDTAREGQGAPPPSPQA